MIQLISAILIGIAFIIAQLAYRKLVKANDRLIKASQENMEANIKYMEAVNALIKSKDRHIEVLVERCNIYEIQLFGKEETV